ncbi:MAG: serine/threonine-protein kinase, partial [Polyangiaceae bacterium]
MDERSREYLGFAKTLSQLGLSEKLRTSQTIARPQSVEASVSLPPVAYDAGSDLTPVCELGRGGMGVVHLVTQRSLGRGVAVKSVVSDEAWVRNALVREAQIMGSLEHPNLVPVHALGQREDGTPILVMKHIEGSTLRELLDSPTHEGWKPFIVGHGDMLRAKVEILIQVCRALEFAHSRGVVHRDLKPDNVMIGRFGEVYLLDWGIALRLTERETEPKTLVGTPGYLAPEMAMADPELVDERTDVYLLGATLYEVLAGRMPHDGVGPIAALMQALAGEPPSFAGVDAPAELVALVAKATAKNVVDRISSAQAFREELARFLVFRDAEIVAQGARLAYRRALDDAEGGERALLEARFGFMTALR